MSSLIPNFEKGSDAAGEILDGRFHELTEAEQIGLASIEAVIGPEMDARFASVDQEFDEYGAIVERELSNSNPMFPEDASQNLDAARNQLKRIHGN